VDRRKFIKEVGAAAAVAVLPAPANGGMVEIKGTLTAYFDDAECHKAFRNNLLNPADIAAEMLKALKFQIDYESLGSARIKLEEPVSQPSGVVLFQAPFQHETTSRRSPQ